MKIGLLISEEGDPSWQKMFFWIKSFGHEPIVIYDTELVNNLELILLFEEGKSIFCLKNIYENLIDFNKIDIFFQRKWNGNIFQSITSKDKSFENQEIIALREFILHDLKIKGKLIGFCSKESNNKLIQLATAQRVGFKVPKTVITNIKKKLTNEFKNDKIILKAMDSVFLKVIDNKIMTNYTERVKLNEIESDFFCSMFQLEIKKRTELRIFYFLENFYSVASIANDINEEVDIRILIAENKIEYYPFDLPKTLKEKIIELMRELDLDMGSLDLIVDNDENYYFIDLNPFGQISMLSSTCFPFIEKDIVFKLINQNEKASKNNVN
jgi:hypothetical protein